MEPLIKSTIGNREKVIPQIISCNASDDNLLISLSYEAYADKITVDNVITNINEFYNKIEKLNT
jgi:hypothetical protein